MRATEVGYAESAAVEIVDVKERGRIIAVDAS
jgi:hypothetical protein